MLVSTWWRGPKRTAAVHIVKGASIDSIKAEYKTDTEFVSTNDIIGSEIPKILGDHCGPIFIPTNLRNRLSCFTTDPSSEDGIAGNVLLPVMIPASDLNRPIDMRRRLKALLEPGYDRVGRDSHFSSFD